MEAKINKLQFFCLIPNILYAKAIGITSGVVVRSVGADVWLSMLIGFLFGTVIILMTIYLGSRFPEKTIIQYSKDIMGKWLSKLIGILLALFFALAYIVSANTVTLHLKEYLLPNTPFLVICLLYTLLSLYGVLLGIEVVLRLSFISFLSIIILNILGVVGTIGDFDISNLLPVMDRGLTKDLAASVLTFGDLGFTILGLSIIYPMLNKKTKSLSLTFWSAMTATFLVLTWPFMETGTMGAHVMQQFTVVCMQHIRSAQLTKFFPRSELIMVVLFVWSAYIQSTVLFFCSNYCIKQITGIKKEWLILTPLTAILITGVYYLGFDHNKYVDFLTNPWPQISAIFSIGLPLLLLAISLFRRKKTAKC